MSIGLKILNNEDFTTGDPIFCSKCSAAFNMYSHLEEDKTDDELKQVWTCEFCNSANNIVIDKSEMPDKDKDEFNLNYILEKPEVKEDINEGKEEKTAEDAKDTPIIFCIDISGSMGCRTNKKDQNGRNISRLDCIKKAI